MSNPSTVTDLYTHLTSRARKAHEKLDELIRQDHLALMESGLMDSEEFMLCASPGAEKMNAELMQDANSEIIGYFV
ncbi:MAG: hypothetical protein ABIO72_03615 [Patescibacteria group bacterium]